jgi:hypothetical protein
MGVEGEAGGIFEKQVVETRQKHNRSEEGRAPRIFFSGRVRTFPGRSWALKIQASDGRLRSRQCRCLTVVIRCLCK